MASKFKSVSRNQNKTTITSATTTTMSKTLIKPKTKTKLQTDTMSKKIAKAVTIATRTTTLAKATPKSMTTTGATQNSVANKLNTNKPIPPTMTTKKSTVKSASTLTRSNPTANMKVKTATTTTTSPKPKKNFSYISTTAASDYCYGGACNIHTDWRLPHRSSVFAYDLSEDEKNCFLRRQFNSPMKSVPDAEIQLLRNGLRQSYLTQRYERTPDDKYNYPEATSWRYGWFHKAWRDSFHRPCTLARAHDTDENRICRGIVTAIERSNDERTNSRHKNAAKAFLEGVNYRGHQNNQTSIASSKSKAKLVGYVAGRDTSGGGGKM